jgi:hypothetical protein
MNLGIAMGAGVDQMNRQQELDRADRGDLRQQQMHDAQMAEIKKKQDADKALAEFWQGEKGRLEGSWQDRASYLAEAYNKNDATHGYNDGQRVQTSVAENGFHAVPIGADGKPNVGAGRFFSPEDVDREYARGIHSRLASISPAHADKFLNWLDTDRKETAVEKRYAAQERRLDGQTEVQKRHMDIIEKNADEDRKLRRQTIGLQSRAQARADAEAEYENLLRAPVTEQLRGLQLGAKTARKAGLSEAAGLYDQAGLDFVRGLKGGEHRNNRYFSVPVTTTDEFGQKQVTTKILDRETGKYLNGDEAPMNQPAAPTHEVGKIYKDKAGNRAKFLGDGKWEDVK